jgi:hypothetical protein
MYIRTYEFPACWVHEYEGYVHIVHRNDDSSSVFAPPKDQAGNNLPDFIAAAHEMGYSDIMRYAVEHELAHQHVSLAMGRECSWVVWDDAHKHLERPEPPEWADEWPNRPQDEEHLVNRLQRFCNLGVEDDQGCLRGVFGDRLEEVARQFVALARPWLRSITHG